MPFQKAYFKNLDTGKQIFVQFNPTDLAFSKGAQFAEIAIPGLDAPVLQFIRGSTETLTVELFFDSTDSGMGEAATSVTKPPEKEKYGGVNDFYELVKQNPKTHAPPKCQFGWGPPAKQGEAEEAGKIAANKLVKAISDAPFYFTCVVESIERKFLLFSPEGVPLRARLTVKLREYQTVEQMVALLQSADHTKARVFKRRERLDQIAAAEYGSPAEWRRIADANKLDNPLRIPPGTILEIPPIRIEPATGGIMVMATSPTQFQPIYQHRDFYVPSFEVKVGGANLEKETLRDIIDVRYTDSIDKFDNFEITVNNWDEVKQDFKYTGLKADIPDEKKRDELFDPGQEIELWMGYYKPFPGAERSAGESGPLRLMLAGIITELSPTFPAGGQPTLKVKGVNALAMMATKQMVHTYPAGKRDSDIAKEVGDRGNLRLRNMVIPVRINDKAKAEENPNLESVTQANEFDILFLIKLAHKNGYDVVLQEQSRNGRTEQFLYFGPSTQDPPASYLLEWGRSLIQFQPTLVTANQVKQLTVRGWDAQHKRAINVTVSRKNLPTRPLRDLDRLYRIEQGFQGNHEIIVDRPFRSEGEARRYALDKLGRLTRDMVTAHGITLGTPGLRAGRRLKIQRLGRTFDGEYFITSSTHSIGAGGYTTEFDTRLEEKNR
jgi:phage protein D